MEKFAIKDNKNYCSGTQINKNGVVGTLIITIESKIIFVTDTVIEDISSEYQLAERDGCGC